MVSNFETEVNSNLVKSVCKKEVTCNVILNGEKLKMFPIRSKQRQKGSILPCHFSNALGVLANSVNKKGKVRVKWTGFVTDDIDITHIKEYKRIKNVPRKGYRLWALCYDWKLDVLMRFPSFWHGLQYDVVEVVGIYYYNF